MWVTASRVDSQVEVHVTDQGRWLVHEVDPMRGRGLRIIHAVTADAEVRNGPLGTELVMTFDLEAPASISGRPSMTV